MPDKHADQDRNVYRESGRHDQFHAFIDSICDAIASGRYRDLFADTRTLADALRRNRHADSPDPIE